MKHYAQCEGFLCGVQEHPIEEGEEVMLAKPCKYPEQRRIIQLAHETECVGQHPLTLELNNITKIPLTLITTRPGEETAFCIPAEAILKDDHWEILVHNDTSA